MFRGKVASNDSPSPSHNKKQSEETAKDPASAEKKGKKKRSRGRRRKGKSRNNKQEPHKKQQQLSSANSKKQHDAPMKKRDLYFSMTCAMVAVKGGGSVVARVTLVNWDMEMVLDTFVHVPVPVSDFGDSGVTASDIRKSITNVKARSFAQVRQDVEKILCGKILIGYHLTEHLTALGLTHPVTDVRDCAGFFGDASLRELTEVLLHRDLPTTNKTDYPFQCCCAVLDLYKTHREEWEKDLIHQAQEHQKLLMQQQQEQQQQHAPSQGYHYHTEHAADPYGRHAMMHPYASHHQHQQHHHHSMMAQHAMEDNPSWFVRGATNAPISSPTQSNPALSSRAMQALSSYSHSGFDEAFERESSLSYDSSSIIDSSVDYSSSIFGNSSHGGTASVASWQEEQQQQQEPSESTSWFPRFGSNKKAPPPPSSSTSSPPWQKVERRMSAVCEEEADFVEEEELPQAPSLDKEKEKSWFAFRRAKSPNHDHHLDESRNDLDKSRTHAARDFVVSQPPEPPILDNMEPVEAEAPPAIPEPTSNERSSSWFSKIRRAKSPTNTKVSSVVETQSLEATESTLVENDDDDWLQEVMDNKKPAPGASEDGSIQEAPNSGTWFRFLRSPRSPKTNRSRLPSLENEFSSEEFRDLKLEPGTSFDEDTNNNNNNLWVEEGSLNDAGSNWSDAPIFSSSRNRLATESTIPSIDGDVEEDDLNQDILIGMEQNLAFLNI